MERGNILVNGGGFSLRARCQGGGCPWPRGWRSTFEAVTYNSRWERWLGAIVWVWGLIEPRRNLPEVSITIVSPSLSVRAGVTARGQCCNGPFRLAPSARGILPVLLPAGPNRGVACRIRLRTGLPSQGRPQIREFSEEPWSCRGRVLRLAYGITQC